MREKELIVYRDFEDGELLYDMAFLMSHYDDEYYNTEDMAALFYECIHDLIDLAGNYGFHGNLWHCYLANLLVNNENSYSCGCDPCRCWRRRMPGRSRILRSRDR